jgi:hypothetical protein
VKGLDIKAVFKDAAEVECNVPKVGKDVNVAVRERCKGSVPLKHIRIGISSVVVVTIYPDVDSTHGVVPGEDFRVLVAGRVIEAM